MIEDAGCELISCCKLVWLRLGQVSGESINLNYNLKVIQARAKMVDVRNHDIKCNSTKNILETQGPARLVPLSKPVTCISGTSHLGVGSDDSV